MRSRRLPFPRRGRACPVVVLLACATLLSGCSLAWKHPDKGFIARLEDWDQCNMISTGQAHAALDGYVAPQRSGAAVMPVDASSLGTQTRVSVGLGMAAGATAAAAGIIEIEMARAPYFKACMLGRGYRPGE